jgi:hypothetical protein
MQPVLRVDRNHVRDFIEVVIVRCDPEDRYDDPAERTLERSGESYGTQRLVDGVERTTEKAGLLSGRYEEAVAIQYLVQTIRRTGRGRLECVGHTCARRGIEPALDLIGFPAICPDVVRVAGEERGERGMPDLVVVDDA